MDTESLTLAETLALCDYGLRRRGEALYVLDGEDTVFAASDPDDPDSLVWAWLRRPRRVCAWCRTLIDEGGALGNPRETHGICLACERRQRAKAVAAAEIERAAEASS